MRRPIFKFDTEDLKPQVVLEYDDVTGALYANGAILTSSTSSITNISADTILDPSYGFIKATAGVSGIAITLPTATGLRGQIYRIIKVDASVGTVTINTTSSQTINSDTSYILTNRWQFVEVIADETGNWLVMDLN